MILNLVPFYSFLFHCILFCSILQVFYPFDSRSEVSKKGGHKEFIISTMTNIWEYGGWKDYEIHVGFTNNELTLTDRWPRGTCSGPYTLTGS